jgi:hypothetical protein
MVAHLRANHGVKIACVGVNIEGVWIKTLVMSKPVRGSDLMVSLTLMVKHATARNIESTNHSFTVVSLTS